jgi:2-iminoacetate synthase
LTKSPFPSGESCLYAPLYLSCYCVNHCLYCGFRCPHVIERQHLDKAAALNEADVLWRRGFRHILLVAGDFPRLTSTDYFVDVIESLVTRGFSAAIEIAPQSSLSYSKMIRAGACGVTLYQETYQEDSYARYHPRGPKLWFDWRLEALERAAEAGVSRLGLGILLGLSNPLNDIWALIRHGQYLQDRFPDVSLAISLPRIHEGPEGFESAYPVDDVTLTRLFCALRIAFPTAELVLSTRERPALREHLAKTCVTQMSAGSCTAPGGYSDSKSDLRKRRQFPVADRRSSATVARSLRRAGFDVRWNMPDAGNTKSVTDRQDRRNGFTAKPSFHHL